MDDLGVPPFRKPLYHFNGVYFISKIGDSDLSWDIVVGYVRDIDII